MALECHALRKAFVTVLHCYRSGSTQFLSLLTLPPSQMRMNPAAVRSKCLLNDRNRWLLRLPYCSYWKGRFEARIQNRPDKKSSAPFELCQTRIVSDYSSETIATVSPELCCHLLKEPLDAPVSRIDIGKSLSCGVSGLRNLDCNPTGVWRDIGVGVAHWFVF